MSLIDDIRSGSSDAVKQLYQENAQDVYDFAKGITKDHDTAMQATRNTLSKLVQEIQDGSEPANLHSEALKLAYDEACKIAMPSVQNVKSPYDEEEEEAAPVKETRSAKRQEQYADDYEDDYDRQRRSQQSRGNRESYSRQQQSQRRTRDGYYDDYDRYDRYNDRYDDYDDYDYEEKSGHGAGFYICLVINIILVLLLIWFLIGLLVNLGVLPDSLNMLGYNWFNETIYPLF